MNITEANAVNIFLRYALGLSPLPTDAEGQAAAEQLADRAHKAVHAGLTPETVAAAWPETQFCPAQDDSEGPA